MSSMSSTVPRPRPLSTGDLYAPRTSSTASVAYLRDAISSLDTKMALLISERRDLEAKLEQEVRMQSPVLRLPSELLSSIFVMGVLGIDDENPVMVPTLMLVCRYWADVALNTPVLWAKISVSPHDSLEKAQRRVERSKSCPLDVSVNFGPRLDSPANVTDLVVRAMDLFRPVLWRTRSFVLSVPNRHQAHAALMRCKADAPLLEHLTVHIYHSMQEDAHYSRPALPLFNGHTPRLRSCSLTSFNFGWDLGVMARLRVLKLGGYFNGLAPSAGTLLAILRQCPELEEIALRNLSDPDASHPCSTPGMSLGWCSSSTGEQDADLASSGACAGAGPTKTIYLPRLAKASFYYAGVARQVMAALSCPALESLEMCYLENVTGVLQVLYAQALTRLPLRYLRIESCLFNELKFVGFLRHVPSLVTLELVDVEDVSAGFLRGLSSSQPWVCPRLESVTLDGCTSLDWDSLRTFVEARLPPNPHTYKRFHPNASSIMSSASEAAAALARSKSRYSLRQQAQQSQAAAPVVGVSGGVGVGVGAGVVGMGVSGGAVNMMHPKRLRMIDVTRCTQISKEMVQWLRMYVAEVKCEPAKGVWGDHNSV